MTPRAAGAFATELISLRTQLAELGGLAEEQLANALDALRRRDVALAREVAARDTTLDAWTTRLEERSLRMLAFRQPLAHDLRETIACLRIASTLERVGDLAKNIARRTQYLPPIGSQRIARSLDHMGELAQSQLSASLDAYGAKDIPTALSLWRRDVELDDLYHSLFRDLVGWMMRNPNMVEAGAQLMFIAKNLERIGDHATFLAEMAYYVSVGEPIKDDRPKGSPLEPHNPTSRALASSVSAPSVSRAAPRGPNPRPMQSPRAGDPDP